MLMLDGRCGNELLRQVMKFMIYYILKKVVKNKFAQNYILT